jgi:hypothetical protein
VLKFTNFNLEDSTDCSKDKLTIADKEPYCGDENPSSYITKTKGEPLTILFETDNSITKTGFRIEYTSTEYCSTEACITVGGISLPMATSTAQSLTSDGFGEEDYGNNLDCGWKISATDTTKCIELEFLDFNVEKNIAAGSCSFDSLTIYDGPDVESGVESGQYCGSLGSSSNLPNENKIKSIGKDIFLQFTTDVSGMDKGFRISYKEVSC